MDNSALPLPHERLQHDSDQDPLAYSETQYQHLQAIQYYTIEEFNADSKAECGQINLAHVARN